MAVIAKKAGTVKKLKASLKKGGSSFIKNVPKDGGITVRFMIEPEDFIEYKEYYSETMEPRFFPEIDGMDPDIVADLRAPSKRWLACAVDTDENKVIAIKLPMSLVDSLMKKHDKYHTICDRDYELVRDGDGFDTTYEAIPEAPKKRNMGRYQALDLLQVLEDSVPDELKADTGDEDDDDPPWEDDDDKPLTKTRRKPVEKRRTSGGSTRRELAARKKTTAKKPLPAKRPLRRK